jgi:hypothetical protein
MIHMGVGKASGRIPAWPSKRRAESTLRLRRIHDMIRALAIAGYLYFPQYEKRKKSDDVELKFAKDAVSVNLPLGKP